MKTQSVLLMTALVLLSCTKMSLRDAQLESDAKLAATSGGNGRITARPVYYDAKLFTVNMFELSDDAAKKIIANGIAQSDDGLVVNPDPRHTPMRVPDNRTTITYKNILAI